RFSRMATRAASSSTCTPSARALSSFDPAACPANTTFVLEEIEPVTLAPSFSSFSWATERLNAVNYPVRTTVLPLLTIVSRLSQKILVGRDKEEPAVHPGNEHQRDVRHCKPVKHDISR